MNEQANRPRRSQAIQVETWPIDKLIPCTRNPHENDAVDRVCSSIRQHGCKIPALALSDGEIIDGHLGLKAFRNVAVQAGPVIVYDEWTPAQGKAFRLFVW